MDENHRQVPAETDGKSVALQAEWNPLYEEWRKYHRGMVIGSDEDLDGFFKFVVSVGKPLRREEIKKRIDMMAEAHEARMDLAHVYSWAVPNSAALDAIAACSPIVEIGAGTGYWALLLSRRGADIVAYDRDPPLVRENQWHRKAATSWFPVHEGGPEVAAQYPDRTLMLCWPPYDEPMANDCLKHYKGERLVFIGESGGGCTADDAFWTAIEEQWNLVWEIDIPQWHGLHDGLKIFKRKT